MERKRIGRILSSTQKHSRVELTEDAEDGMLIEVNRKGIRYMGRLERIEVQTLGGLVGYVYWLDPVDRPFSNMTDIFIAEEEFESGHIYIGKDTRDIIVKLPVNPFFGHTLVSGITTSGKTHSLIVLVEEFGPLNIPCLVIDTHGEFINLPMIDSDKYIVVEDLRIDNFINYMQQKKIVIYNLLGYTKKSKISRVSELLEEIMHEKERDYQQANEDHRLLNLPPIILIIDEADIFAPNIKKGSGEGARESVAPMVDLLERGAKFGLAAIVATQRITRLDIDVRSQCNSAIVFRMIDQGGIIAVHNIDYIPKEEISRIRGLLQGEAIIAGRVVRRARRVKIRDIVAKRAKHRDFEEMLGIPDSESGEVFESRFDENEHGDVIDTITGEVIHDSIDKLIEQDLEAFEATEGDGVILRSHITPEEQKVLNKLRKANEKGDRLIG